MWSESRKSTSKLQEISTLMTSQLMTSYRKTNIAEKKQKKTRVPIVITHVNLAS